MMDSISVVVVDFDKSSSLSFSVSHCIIGPFFSVSH
eukprot:CCRYP_017022-RA/>CCRYP_017022-RA protein AED:0.00 eAED:0.00 QI:161/1/1/1/0/0/2/0/35